MTDYRTDDGGRVTGAELFSRLRSGPWDLVSSEDDGTVVVEDADGDPIVLRPIEGTAETASGPHTFEAGEG